MSDISTFLDKLNALKKTDTIDIWIPSQDRSCKFTHITVNQQKELLKSSVEGAAGLVNFAKILNEIIIDNCLDKNVEINSIDKHPILIALRAASMGNLITIEDKEYNLFALPLKSPLPPKKLKNTVSHKGVDISIKTPTLKNEISLYDQCVIDIKKLKDSNINDSIPILYTFEIIKFIESITFEHDTIDFQSLSHIDKKRIIENLPIGLTQKVINFISTIRKIEEKFITFPDKVVVTINTLFFSAD